MDCNGFHPILEMKLIKYYKTLLKAINHAYFVDVIEIDAYIITLRLPKSQCAPHQVVLCQAKYQPIKSYFNSICTSNLVFIVKVLPTVPTII